MPNTVVTKLVTRRLGQRDFETGPLFDTLLPASSPAPPPLLLPCPDTLRIPIVSGCGCCQALSSPPPLLHLLSGTSFPPLLHPHQTVIQDRRCSLRATLADWFPFLGALRAPWPVQVFPAADTGQYWFFLASGIWPVLVFLSVFPFSVLIMGSTGFS